MTLHISSPQELLARMLKDRNIPLDQADSFLKPRYELADPYLFAQMEEAVLRLFSAIEAKEPIGVYADYDCDGIPGAVVLTDLFKKIGYENYHLYIPDRHDEGYGLKEQGINELHAKGVRLIITIDLGITAIAEIVYANTLGIDVVVTDHHTPLETYPVALAVIHPKHGEYPNKHACGAAVIFHLVRAFIKKYGDYFKVPHDWEKWLLDMVGFATLSDMVPLIGENRVLAKYGLIVMRRSRRVGLRTLLRNLKIEQATLTEDDLTFMVAPRLNAASRMDDPIHAFNILATTSIDEAQKITEHLSVINADRKTLVAQTMREAEAKLKDRELGEVVVVGDVKWHPPILGLVAARLQDVHGKTVFVWGKNGGEEIKGSCRSPGMHNVSVLMQNAQEHFLHFGGHTAAGGFSVMNESVHFLEEKLNEVATSAATETVTETDPYLMALSAVHKKYWDVVETFMPFGTGNPKPQFLFSDVAITNIKPFGKGKEHIEITVTSNEGTATAISFFNTADSFSDEPLREGKTIILTGTMDYQQGYYGKGVRLRIEKIK